MSTKYDPNTGFNNRAEFFWVGISMLLMDKEDAIIPEIMYFMTPDQVMKMVEVFGGSTIYVPTGKELGYKLKAALAAYYKTHLGMGWDEIGRRLRMTGVHLNPVRKNVERWEQYVQQELGLRPELILARR